ncbi:MAG: hypothetical protein ACO1NV_10260 [Leptospira bouyouniensis]|nr:hypothetical protein [Leptospira bouyouniensis]
MTDTNPLFPSEAKDRLVRFLLASENNNERKKGDEQNRWRKEKGGNIGI